MKLLKLSKLSTLALAFSLSLGAAMPAEANIFGLLFEKKQHHAHQQPHNRHHGHNESHSNHRVHSSGDRNYRRSNHHTRNNFPRRRVVNHQRSYGRYGSWRGRHY